MEIRFIRNDETTLPIPYRADLDDGGTNNGFFDLKTDLNQIENLRELNGFPELQFLVMMLNQPESSMRTLRIDTCQDKHLRYGFRHSCFGMLTFAMEFGHEKDEDFFREFPSSLRQYCADFDVPYASETIFGLSRFEVPSNKTAGWCLDFRLITWAKQSDTARMKWRTCFKPIAQWLLIVEKENRFRDTSPIQGMEVPAQK
jgi:hypothetical protein